MCEGARLHQPWGNTRAALRFCYSLRKLPSCVADITAAALATGACIVGILCLPLILLLIYKQRQAVSSRRTYRAHLPGCITMVVWADVCPTGARAFGCPGSHGHYVRWPKGRSPFLLSNNRLHAYGNGTATSHISLHCSRQC